MRSIKLMTLAVMAVLTFSSCSNDDDAPVQVNEEEVITTVTVTLTDGTDTIVLSSYDADGEGSGAPVVTTTGGNLKQNKTYNGTIELLNQMENPAENITQEVQQEGLEHQFFYTINPSNLASFAYSDTDTNGNPIGIQFTMTTSGITGSGTVNFILKHQPNKTATGVSTGDITNAGGSTDVDVTFDVTVE